MSEARVIDIESPWMTTRTAMKYLGVSRDFIDDLRESAELSFYKVGHTVFMKKADIDRLIQSKKVI